MKRRFRHLCSVFVVAMVAGTVAGGWPVAGYAGAAPPQPVQQEPAPSGIAAADATIYSYAAKFVCTEALPPGHFYYGLTAPIVQQKTDVLVHNPNGYAVELYKKAVIAPVERYGQVEQGQAPGKWHRVTLAPDYAFRIDCDDIAKLLTGNPAATFAGTYGIGVTVEGYVVVGIGLQQVPGTNVRRQGILDVTGEYVRSSEVMKKDVHFQPWWRWWWWSLPWRLGYAYQRIIPIDAAKNIDCRAMLYDALAADVQREMGSSPNAGPTTQALEAGRAIDPSNMSGISQESAPALVAMIGRCDKLSVTHMTVDYVLLSNKSNSDPDPRSGATPVQVAVRYPWIPGRWYDLALVTPQNLDVDIHDYFVKWQTQRWVNAGAKDADVQQVMTYWFPYWCGWGYWWWWWNGGDCIDIGVGEGESLDVEQITPARVFIGQWPPSQ